MAEQQLTDFLSDKVCDTCGAQATDASRDVVPDSISFSTGIIPWMVSCITVEPPHLYCDAHPVKSKMLFPDNLILKGVKD